MKEMKKISTILFIAALMILLLAGCGNRDAGAKEASGEIEGQTVSYGPITITLPEEYVVKEKYPNCPIYYAMDVAEAEDRPTIRFLTKSETITSNADINKENFIDRTKEVFDIMEDSEFKEVISYEETELGEYKVITVLTKSLVYGEPLVVEYCYICEKIGSTGNLICVQYNGLESDTEHLAVFEACLDTMALKTEMNKSGSVWQRIFYFESGSDGNPLSTAGDYVEYGPLHMQVPESYTAEEDGAGSIVFSNSDGASFCASFTEGSYQRMSDQAYAENLFQEELEREGITDVNLINYEPIRVSGYDGYEAFIQADKNGESVIRYIYVVFETSDEDMTPAFEITYAASEETARKMTEDVDTVFNSVRLLGE